MKAGVDLGGTKIQAVVVAKEPMPSVSKKLVTAPRPIASGLGRVSPRFEAVPRRTMVKAMPSAASATSKTVIVT